LLLVATLAPLACGVLDSVDDRPSPDGNDASPPGDDADATTAGDAPATGFRLELDPPHVTADKGDRFDVAIRVVRAASFTGVVQFAVSGAPLGIDTNIPAAAPGDTSALTIRFTAPDDGDWSLAVTGSGSGLDEIATLGMRVGSVVVPDKNGSFLVPTYAVHGFDVKAWGAGGGGNFGGAGGFASARVYGVPGETLFVDVGTAGGQGGYYESGGGGFSGLRRGAADYLLVAGGGGGGGSPICSGGGGGGATGDPGGCSDPGDGGSQTNGGVGGSGAEAGAHLRGGNAAATGSGSATGGLPGGGNSGFLFDDVSGSMYASGGGGGGWFGGGGGGEGNSGNLSGAGGGGSGHVSDAGIDASLLTATFGFPPNYQDPDYGDGGTAGRSGKNGLVVIRLPKPY